MIGQEKWLAVHHDLLNSEIMDEILKNPLNFGDDGLVKDSVIDNFGLTCPNMCGGISRGKCVKSKKTHKL
jgi:hypothetical protein